LTAWGTGHNGYGLPKTSGSLSKYLSMPLAVHSCEPDWHSSFSKDEILYCPAYDYIPDENDNQPMNTYHCSSGPSWPTTGDWMIRSYRENDWLLVLPASFGWNNSGTDKGLTRMVQLRSPNRMILSAEGYTKSLFSSWGGLYYNPNHGGGAPSVHADGHVDLIRDEGYAFPGGLWYTHWAGSTYAVESWGTYLHPDYNKSY
ncbi:MAG: hypothetical protein KGZ25_14595, partial [Planctomycetes bacterium]|nr:hypothetical protein [Planctomycetota bacterium]